MEKSGNRIRFITEAAVIAALYTALTYLASAMNLAYGAVQFRFSEALTVLPVLTPAAIPGLTLGCILSNLASPFGIWDIVFGSLATLLACVITYFTRKITIKGLPVLSPIITSLVNGLIIGIEISAFMPQGFTFKAMLIEGSYVFLGEIVITFALGLPLFSALKRTKIFKIK